MSESRISGLRKVGPGACVLAGGLGILSCRDPWTALGTSISMAGVTWIIYSVLSDVLDRFNMTVADLL